ncbi:MAG: DUF4118 domain-containing protein [Angustibacter sp.]
MNLRDVVRGHRAATTLLAAALPVAAAATLSLVRDSVSGAVSVLVLVAFVVAAGATGVRTAGLAAAVTACASFDFFLTTPYGSFAIGRREDVEATVLLLVIGGIVTETALWGLRQEAASARQAGYLGGLMTTAETLSAHHDSSEEVTRDVAQRIIELLKLDACRFVMGAPPDPASATIQHSGAVVRGGLQLDVDRTGLPVDAAVILPSTAGGEVRGYFVLTAATHVARPTVDQRRVAALLADQVAAWLGGTASDVPRQRA